MKHPQIIIHIRNLVLILFNKKKQGKQMKEANYTFRAGNLLHFVIKIVCLVCK